MKPWMVSSLDRLRMYVPAGAPCCARLARDVRARTDRECLRWLRVTLTARTRSGPGVRAAGLRSRPGRESAGEARVVETVPGSRRHSVRQPGALDRGQSPGAHSPEQPGVG